MAGNIDHAEVVRLVKNAFAGRLRDGDVGAAPRPDRGYVHSHQPSPHCHRYHHTRRVDPHDRPSLVQPSSRSLPKAAKLPSKSQKVLGIVPRRSRLGTFCFGCVQFQIHILGDGVGGLSLLCWVGEVCVYGEGSFGASQRCPGGGCHLGTWHGMMNRIARARLCDAVYKVLCGR